MLDSLFCRTKAAEQIRSCIDDEIPWMHKLCTKDAPVKAESNRSLIETIRKDTSSFLDTSTEKKIYNASAFT